MQMLLGILGQAMFRARLMCVCVFKYVNPDYRRKIEMIWWVKEEQQFNSMEELDAILGARAAS